MILLGVMLLLAGLANSINGFRQTSSPFDVVGGQDRVLIGDGDTIHIYTADGRFIADSPTNNLTEAIGRGQPRRAVGAG